MADDCPACGHSRFVTKEDAGGEYEVCTNCGRRQDGLGRLQDRLGL